MIMQTKTHGDVDLGTATRNTLLEIKDGLNADLQDINGQLQDARIAFRTTGERSDPDWYQSARGARRAVIKRLSRIDVALRTAPKEHKPPSDKGQRVADLFVDVARVRLQDEVFAGILEDAIERWEQATLDPSASGVLFP